MKHFLLFSILYYYIVGSFAQSLPIGKPSIDSSVYSKWPSVEDASISNDGKYALYNIRLGSLSTKTVNKVVFQSTNTNWRLEMPGASNALITQDSRLAIFINSKDSLGILSLGSSFVEYIPQVNSFRLLNKDVDNRLVYQLNTPEKKLVIRSLMTGKEKSFSGVNHYAISDNEKILILQTESKKGNVASLSLNLVKLADGNMVTIWSTEIGEQRVQAGNIVFNKNNTKLAFTVGYKINDQIENSFWYYLIGEDNAVLLADKKSTGIDSGLQLDNIRRFSNDDSVLFFNLKRKDFKTAKSDVVKLNVWSYTDAALQSYQLKNQIPPRYISILNLTDHRIIRLEQENEMIELFPLVDDIALVSVSRKGGEIDVNESPWNGAHQQPVYLISTKDGKRKRLKELETKGRENRNMSPEGKYMIYYDGKKKNYFSYETASDIIRNITINIPTVWTIFGDDHVEAGNVSYSSAGWLKGDTAVFFYDQYDIWQIDPTGHKIPINITNGYGRKHNISFEVIKTNSNNPFVNNETLVLSAFNRGTKKNGFYRKILGKSGDPELLSMGDYFYFAPNAAPRAPDGINFSPIKARDAQIYLVRRMNAKESPNYFITTDFKTFTLLSDIHPESKYNWLIAELHSLKISDGNIIQGILYKPENFDPKKKYPTIIHYYEILSNGLNAYLKPCITYGSLNVPLFVSNGYLVFEPDIHYKIGEPGESALKVVESAASYLSKMSFVDAKRIGIQGFSFGGFETNYIVTHSNLFAAACSASGIFNFVSGYGSLSDGGSSLQGIYESGQTRIGASLWQRPDLYLKNSAVFKADKVTTPFLMMHTTNDGACPFSTALEFFIGLRRLGKKAWMLQYDDADHGLFGKQAEDFEIRMIQFFNHYLKDALAPKWMTRGIPAKMKGLNDGLELDLEIKTPGPGLLKKNLRESTSKKQPLPNN